MTPIFIFGTLCHRPLLDLVAGQAVKPRPAYFTGHDVVWVSGATYPMLTPGQAAQGLVFDAPDDALARLDFYESCFDYHRHHGMVHTDNGPISAQFWMPQSQPGQAGDAWDLAQWVRDYGDITMQAADEIMRQYGTATPSQIAGRFSMIRSRAQSYVTATKWHRPHTIGTSRTRDDVQIDRIKHPYDGFFTIEEITAKFRRFDGTWSAPMHRAVFRAADAVTVLPYDPTRDRVMMVEQIRSGPLAHGDPTPWLLEGIAGMIDIGETPQDAARREAIEEAGITLSDLHFVAQYYPTPGGVAQRLYSYIAIADLPDDITGIGGHADEGEDILSHLVPFDLALDRVQSGEIADAPLIISLQWLAANRVRLRDQDQPG